MNTNESQIADEKQLEKAKEIALSALKGAQVTINLEDFSNRVFPIFKRKPESPITPTAPKRKESKLGRSLSTVSLLRTSHIKIIKL